MRHELAPAKINLTLAVLGRRSDGYHDIESLVAFAVLGDSLALTLGRELALTVRGPMARATGPLADNLVLKAARALADRIDPLKCGRFILSKRLPAAAGIGGGSADAAAALRLLARANHLSLDDSRLREAARVTGADVPVCLDPRARIMRGIGEILSAPLDLPRLPAVLVNPGVALATREVFSKLHSTIGRRPLGPDDAVPSDRDGCLSYLRRHANELEKPAILLEPSVDATLAALRATPECRLARMSGSGATCFGLFDSMRAATDAARVLRRGHPGWWVRATTIG
ncbi:MAG TPA: 4-(cytidine 5'-diphospho)-2-C-methyl-D-erythritol kinase [Xanthobacteraceae bacterium]